MQELKPCPFCGGEARVCHFSSFVNSAFDSGYYIKCNKCGTTGHKYFTTMKQAIRAWNRRVENDQ